MIKKDMTVKQLINKLQKCKMNAPVFVSVDGSYHDVLSVIGDNELPAKEQLVIINAKYKHWPAAKELE